MAARRIGALLHPGLAPLVLAVLSVFVIASDDIEKRHRRIDSLIHRVWDERGITGFGLPPNELELIRKAAGITDPSVKGPATYGEITQDGARVVGLAMGLYAETGESMFFLDLGSGVGKLVVQFFLETYLVVNSTGVELSETRKRRADEALAKVAVRRWKKNPGAVTFLHHDIFNIDHIPASPLYAATHIYVSATCFPEAMLERLARHLEKHGEALRVIASLKPFPGGLEGFEKSETVEAEMSWTVKRGGTNTVHIYRRVSVKTEL